MNFVSKRKLVHVKFVLGLSIENLKSLDNGVSCSSLNLSFFLSFPDSWKGGQSAADLP